MILRPSTNLIVPQHLMLPKAELRSNFMYVYSTVFPGSPVVFLTKLWASLFFPSLTNDPQFGKGRFKAKIGDAIRDVTPESYLRVKIVRDDPHIVASIPVFSFKVPDVTEGFDFLHQYFVRKSRLQVAPAKTVSQWADIDRLKQCFVDFNPDEPRDLTFHPTQVIRACPWLEQSAIAHLKSTLLALRIQTKGNLAVVFLDFKISVAEAQQLTTTEWAQIRDIDLYPLLLEWVSTSYGERGLAPIASFPISKIAMTLPRSHVRAARVDDQGISIGPNGRPYYLPRVIDEQQTVEYEQKYIQAGTREDGSYALTDINEGALALATSSELKIKLPHNVPVLIDWVNNKYSYTDTKGHLKVMDLTRFRAAEPSHIRLLLEERHLTFRQMEMLVGLARAANVPALAWAPIASDVEESTAFDQSSYRQVKTPLEWFDIACNGWVEDTEAEDDKVPYSEFSSKGYGPFRPLARWFKIVAKAALSNLGAVYREYSVKTVMEVLPWLILMDVYNDDLIALRALDQKSRAAAIYQGVDPDFKLTPIPLITALREIGFIPHQVKIRNLLRNSPMLAILPVQAGGGKSLLLLTDILIEILHGRHFPYVLLCPGHLLANYVNEVIYFTAGQLNVLPINGEIIRQHGFARLQQMFEHMPRNTVVVVDYDTLRYRQQGVCYGTTPISVYPVIDFLRQFDFKYAGLDESHRCKHETARTQATMCLITDIPKIRLASGTMAHDSPSDLAMQVASMDPTLFGTRDEFNRKYGQSVSGGRVMAWKPGAQEEIRAKINSRVVTAGAMRKEWAAFLPTSREWIGGVDLRPNQQMVYDAILTETLKKIEEDAKSSKELRKFFGNTPDDEDDPLDEDAAADLASLLRPYLARLERFLMAPGKDPLGAKLLSGPDLKSPKVGMILRRIRLHLFGGKVRDPESGEIKVVEPQAGKVLIYTNNILSAEEVWELADPELRKCGMLYKAESKVEHGYRFEHSKKVRWMVGVEQSMNEGLNLQFVARTIRPEAVWNPGTKEQGNSRSNRPELKKREERAFVFYDSIVVNRTIDITKTARLISKIIAVAKFENVSDPGYDSIPDVPIIKMSLESLRTFNTWEWISKEQPGLQAYAEALSIYEKVKEKDYAEYKQAYIEKYGDVPVKTLIEIAPTPEGLGILSKVPYTPGGEIPFKSDLGAVRIDEYLNLAADDLEGDDEEEIEESEFSPLAAKASALKGRLVHTEFGEGHIQRCSTSKYVTVTLRNSYTVRVKTSACFLLSKEVEDFRAEIADLIRIALIEVPEVQAPAYRLTREQSKAQKAKAAKAEWTAKLKREKEIRKALTLDLSLVVSNGYLGFTYDVEHNPTAVQALQTCGFRAAPAFYYARVPKSSTLVEQVNLWADKGLEIDSQLLKAGATSWFAEMFAQLETKQIGDVQQSVIGANKAKIPNFYRVVHKASASAELIKPYPVIENGEAFIAFPKEGQSWLKRAMKYRVPTIEWGEASPTLSCFGTVSDIQMAATKLKAAGVTIRNAEALNQQFRKWKTLKVRIEK